MQMSMQPAMRMFIYAHMIASLEVDASEALACLVLVQAHGPNDWSIVPTNQNPTFRALRLVAETGVG
jgi:hypothetical protein